jgi:hypothetical protein
MQINLKNEQLLFSQRQIFLATGAALYEPLSPSVASFTPSIMIPPLPLSLLWNQPTNDWRDIHLLQSLPYFCLDNANALIFVSVRIGTTSDRF